MQEDTLKEIINDAHNLAMAHVDPGHLRFGIEGIALRLEELQRGTSAANNPVQTHTHTTDKEKPMNLNEKNHVLADALDDIKHFLAERCGGHPDNIEAQYDCNKAAFDHIAKILANAMRLDVFGDEPPKKSWVTSPLGRKLKMLAISMPGKAAIKYSVDDPELPRLTASIETIKSDDGKVSCDCTLYVGNEVLADMQVYRGKAFALAMVRRALKGACQNSASTAA